MDKVLPASSWWGLRKVVWSLAECNVEEPQIFAVSNGDPTTGVWVQVDSFDSDHGWVEDEVTSLVKNNICPGDGRRQLEQGKNRMIWKNCELTVGEFS